MSVMKKVVALFIAEDGEAPMQAVDTVQLESGKGIVGDRYYHDKGTFSEKLAGLPDRELTLIESEKIADFNQTFGFDFSSGDFRRNIVTEGVDLNSLVDQEFSIGAVRLRGIRLCEPCAHLAGVLVPELLPGMVHKAGLRAQILEDGLINISDPIQI
ncbi:MOSC domain-containing protein [Oceanicoccus sagamiensis]|uniref:MOSC domain-containing protein n=1 Tax=Oceanicoccus sagamiensis TaxID=716816 RepID=A0A1X9NHB3_9GAMM|nr:MOSC domain-containing protein [Oceanicoccus sagamiensis]ARN73373.1 hypothetical protein BST96_04160 [Oceanicoccus sagamiensis]